jgi:molybdopterin-containing oxidoreductase family iron-sulfur binding subunit
MYFGDLEDRQSKIRNVLRERYTIRRKPALGTEPQVYYLV